MFRKISVATDGSPLAGKAVEAAAEIAARDGSELTVLHVLMNGEPPEALRQLVKSEHLVDDPPPAVLATDNIPTQLMVAQADAGQRAFDKKVIVAVGEKVVDGAKKKAHQSGVKSVKAEVLEGETADQIVAAVKRNKSDLVVVGSRGLGLMEGLFMGSVSRKVSQEAGCDCLIVR